MGGRINVKADNIFELVGEFRILGELEGADTVRSELMSLQDALHRTQADAEVADRWHLMANASAGFLDAVRKSMASIRSAISATTINPELLTCAEKLQYEGYLRREETNAAILTLAGEGVAIKDIVRRTGHSRKLIRQVIRGERTDVFRVRQSSLEGYLPLLDELWISGCRNGAELWRRLKAKGFRGALRVVSEWGNPSPRRAGV